MALKIIFISDGKTIAEHQLSDEQVKALNTELELADYKCPICGKYFTGIAAWILNVIEQKARQKVDEIVEKSGRGSRFTDVKRKLEIIKELEKEKPELLKSAKERQEELERLAKEELIKEGKLIRGGLNGEKSRR